MSSNKFRNRFLQRVIDLIASHWQHLGIALAPADQAHAGTWIDLESLLVFTLLAHHGEKRVLEAAGEWTIHNRHMINTSRLKRIGSVFTQDRSQYDRQSAKELLQDISTGNTDRFVQRVAEQTGNRSYTSRGIVSEPNLTNHRLLQLKLRGLFGINARAEILLYLLQHESENSNALAREIGFAQKPIYLILESWTDAGVLQRIQKGRAGNYSLTRREHWQSTLTITDTPPPINWIRTFHALLQILDILHEIDDPYLLASRFRDITTQVQLLLSPFSIPMPDPRNFPGEAYMEPFGEALLQAMNQLT